MAYRPVTTESAPVRWLLIGLAFVILSLFLLLPLAAVFIESLTGSYSGVMGLPLFETSELLREAGVPYWCTMGA